MTLQNGLIHKGTAYLWTDTAVWDPATRQIIGENAKAFFGITWPWAAVHSGLFDTSDPHRLARRIGEAYPKDTRELLLISRTALMEEAARGLAGRLLIAFPCPYAGARLCLISSDEMPFARRFEHYETVEYMSSGATESWSAEFQRKDMTPRRMHRYIDRQIEHPGTTAFGKFHNIGGNVVEITVTAAGVESRVLRAVN